MAVDLASQTIKLNLILAMCSSSRGIGFKGALPWRLPKDMKHFAKVTTYTSDPHKMNAAVMGRKTWFSIPKAYRPLPKRLNVIISSTLNIEACDINENADPSLIVICKTFDDAIRLLVTEYKDKIESIYAIGGAQIYKNALEYPTGFLHHLYLTQVHSDIECDTFIEPESFLDSFKKISNVPDKERYIVEFDKEETDHVHNLKYCFELYEKI